MESVSPGSSLRPLLADVGVIALVADHWGKEWMSRHQILTRLARYFRVVWVNPSQDWHDALNQPIHLHAETSEVAPGFHVYGPELWLPKFYRPRYLADLTFRKRLEHARNLLSSQGCKKIILYIWHPQFADSLDAVQFDLSCYHIVDEYTFSDVDLPITDEEQKLLEQADQVVVHTKALFEKKRASHRFVALVPNGVAYSAFSTPGPEPEALAGIPHPRIGYVGYLKKTLDWDILLQLTERHPEYSFVFVGAQKQEDEVLRALQQLSRRPNVHLVGPLPSSDMAPYPQHFDVCIMPYKLNDYTKYIYPLKLHEYLASGRPVIASPTPLLKEFEEVISLCRSVDQWSAAISKALQPAANTAEAREARQEVAKKHDWDLLARRIARIFCERLNLCYKPLLS